MNNNFWGEPDDEPLPSWMDPNTYRNKLTPQRQPKTLSEAIAEALQKPAVPIVLQEPDIKND